MSAQVLLIEDNPGDVRLAREAFHGAKIASHLHVVYDGVEALDFLRHEGTHTSAPRPDLILLDLNLPKMDGRAVLDQIKKNEGLKAIPIVVITSSEAETDVLQSYQLKANCYLSKPFQLEAFEKILNAISDFWLVRAKLPQQMQTG